MLNINEIFYSIQGEGTHAGLPCIFIRLTGCNLRCTWCDTEYSFYEGEEYSVESVLTEIQKYRCNLVQITGGEPLMQDDVHALMTTLCDRNYTVLLETGGSLPIDTTDDRVVIIMDLKTPSSGMVKKNRYENIEKLKLTDEVKFVIADRDDYEWSKEMIEKYDLTTKCHILFSPVFSSIQPVTLAEWILEDTLPVKYQLQLHKYIWKPDTRGV